MNLTRVFLYVGLLLLVGISLANFGLSIHNVVKIKNGENKLTDYHTDLETLNVTIGILSDRVTEGDVLPPSVNPTEDPRYDLSPSQPFKSKNTAHLQVKEKSMSYTIEDYTDKVEFQGHISVRIPRTYVPTDDYRSRRLSI